MTEALYNLAVLTLFFLFASEWHRWRSNGGSVAQASKDALEKAKSLVTKEEKSEYLPPMDDADYEKWQDELSGKTELQEKLDENAPWK